MGDSPRTYNVGKGGGLGAAGQMASVQPSLLVLGGRAAALMQRCPLLLFLLSLEERRRAPGSFHFFGIIFCLVWVERQKCGAPAFGLGLVVYAR